MAHTRVLVDLTNDISAPYAVNTAGDILGLWTDGATTVPAVFHNGARIQLPTLSPTSFNGLPNVYKLNNRGQLLYWTLDDTASGNISTSRRDLNTGTTVDIGKIAGFPSTVGLSFNDSGDIVGYGYSSTDIHPFLWHDNHFSQLAPLPGAPVDAKYSYLYINNPGHVFGLMTSASSSATTWILWRNNVPVVFPHRTGSEIANEEIPRGFDDKDEVLAVYHQNFQRDRDQFLVLDPLNNPADRNVGNATLQDEALAFNALGTGLYRERDPDAGHLGTSYIYDQFAATRDIKLLPLLPPNVNSAIVGETGLNDYDDVLATLYGLSSGAPFGNFLLKVAPAAVPHITGLTPDRAAPGSADVALTLNGTSFDSDSVVTVSGASQPSSHFVSETQMTVTIPSALLTHAGVLPIQVSTPAPGGGASNVLYFNVAVPRPTLASVTPSRIDPGTSNPKLTIAGTDFDPSAVVTVDGIGAITTTVVSPTKITVTLPPSVTGTPGAYFLRVANPGYNNTAEPLQITVARARPVIAALSPNRVPVGLTSLSLYVNGTGIVPGSKVSFSNGTPVTPTSVTASRIIVSVPAAVLARLGRYQVRIVNSVGDGGVSEPLNFEVVARPVLTSVTPNPVTSEHDGVTMTLMGSNFEAGCVVTINDTTTVTPTFITANKVTIVLPSAVSSTPGAYYARVVNTGYANSSGPQRFTVIRK